MSEEHLNEQPEDQPEEKPPVPLTQTLGFGAGTMLAAGMVDLVAHLGPTGLVVGGMRPMWPHNTAPTSQAG